ncbi:cysteine hydrolase family protein [Paenibacillus caui]|uniref:cysteine hydrolase family protein n=1 Tax=Paenibacillus caui TaxID=2873927 RepID=UPI001CAA12B9|nr:cysteine hydrolase family protein [Paenibacillus caui]
MNKALVIIDVQEAFYTMPENYLYKKEELAANINELIAAARAYQVPVIFIQHTEYDYQGDEFYVDSPSWHLYHGLSRSDEDTVVRKTTWDSFHETELSDVLKEKSIEQLIFAGAQTEFCLDTTIRAAYSLGYKNNILAKDSHSTLDNSALPASKIIEHHETVWNGRFVTIQHVKDILF